MGQFVNKKLVIFFGGLILFVGLLVGGADLFLRSIPAESPDINANILPRIEGKNNLPAPEIPKTQFLNPGQAPRDSRMITYTVQGFAPNEITVKASDPIGCLISVVNRTTGPVQIGISPHNPSGDSGVDYGELAAGEKNFYDVFYPGLSGVSIHNHHTPHHEFKVIYGEGCQ